MKGYMIDIIRRSIMNIIRHQGKDHASPGMNLGIPPGGGKA